MADAFTTLDPLDLKEVFECRANVIRIVPHVVRGAFRLAIRAALDKVTAGHEMHSEVRMGRGWKLLMLLPSMLLNRPRRGGHIPHRQLENKCRRFQEGPIALRGSRVCCTSAQVKRQTQEKAPS